MSEWQPIETMPRDGTRVKLLSKSGKKDEGYFYHFSSADWYEENRSWWEPEIPGDITGGLNTERGEGNYTHWMPK